MHTQFGGRTLHWMGRVSPTTDTCLNLTLGRVECTPTTSLVYDFGSDHSGSSAVVSWCAPGEGEQPQSSLGLKWRIRMEKGCN